jgi:DNA polymerase III subunit gamma/tau
MENFIVSARKYRPATFDTVVGQASITNTLKSAIKNNKLAHAYLFCGPRGVGKTTCARIFAKTINCSNLTADYEACNQCESCISFNTLRSFNIHELDAASNNKVEDIRSLNDQVRVPPQIGKYSIYIIDEVHMLTTQAFNAFLKTLEEPPAHAIFILATTEKQKIIPTILSRCQIFDFNRIRIEDIVARLMYVANSEGISAEEEALHVIGQKADGAMRDALSIFDQIASLAGKKISYSDVIENLNVLDYEYYFRTVDAALLGDFPTVLVIFNEILEKGFDGHNFISGLNSHFRDLLVSRDEVTLKLLEATPAIRHRYMQQASRCSAGFLFRALETGVNCDLTYKTSKNPRLNVELALLKLCRLNGPTDDPEKKKSELSESEDDLRKPAKEPVPQQKSNVSDIRPSTPPGPVAQEMKHDPVVEKPVKSFSIKDLMAEENRSLEISEEKQVKKNIETIITPKSEFTPEGFLEAWKEFTARFNGEGTRIISMLNSIRPEYGSVNSITIHFDNAAQKDTFVSNYKPALTNFLESRFILNDFEIETAVELNDNSNVLYTDEQKQSHLMAKFPALAEMKKIFNLDIP